MALAAVFDCATRAGTIASSSGRATVVPIPRSTVRRETAFFVTIMTAISSSATASQKQLHNRAASWGVGDHDADHQAAHDGCGSPRARRVHPLHHHAIVTNNQQWQRHQRDTPGKWRREEIE